MNMGSTASPSTHLRSADDAAALAQFSQRLSQSYEEINLLFRLSHLLNSVDDPVKVVQAVCDQIADILPFQWMAIWFGQNENVVQLLRGVLAKWGKLPCPDAQMKLMASELCRRSNGHGFTRFLSSGKHELATMTGSDVFAQPVTHDDKCVGIILCGNKAGDDPDIASDEARFLEAAANFLAVFHENILRFAQQKAQYLGTMRALSAAIDAKDSYTCGHSDRVALLTAKLAAALELPEAEVEQFRIAGQLHDVGKIGVPEAVLCKVGRLTPEEFAQIKMHPEIGYRILKDIPGMEEILPGVLHHHERWDGKGYPHGLAGPRIPLVARCIALADTFDAMSSARSYRQATARDQVLAEIRRVANSQFNADLAALFVSLDFSEFDNMLASAAAAAAQ